MSSGASTDAQLVLKEYLEASKVSLKTPCFFDVKDARTLNGLSPTMPPLMKWSSAAYVRAGVISFLSRVLMPSLSDSPAVDVNDLRRSPMHDANLVLFSRVFVRVGRECTLGIGRVVRRIQD